MKKLLLLLILTLGFIGSAFAHIEDAIFCKAKIVTSNFYWNSIRINLSLNVVSQNNTDSRNDQASVGVFSSNGELVDIFEVDSNSWVEPGSTGTYKIIGDANLHVTMLHSKQDRESTLPPNEIEQADIDHHFKLYTDMYEGVTCKVFGYN